MGVLVTESNETSGPGQPHAGSSAKDIKAQALPVLTEIYRQLISERADVLADLAPFLAAGAGPGTEEIAACLTEQHSLVGQTLLEAGAGDAAGAHADVSALGWVTPAQQDQLGEVAREGDWRDWLPRDLDLRLPEWRDLSPGELTTTLDGMIGLLALPFDPVASEILEQVVGPAMQELYDQIPELADELLVDPAELKEYIQGLPDEFFMNVLGEAIAQPQ